MLALALVAAAGLAVWVRAELRASLPQLDGQVVVDGLTAPVEVRRDALGVVTIRGAARADVACATGFVHAQERLFQMDLARRQAAGELAELLGQPAADWDCRIRVHRFREVARAVVDSLSAPERQLLDAYTHGVNAGLGALDTAPFEYLLLRTEPGPWRAEDTILTVLSMFITLQPSDGGFDAANGLLHDLLPRDLFRFLTPAGTSWDAPLSGGPLPPPALPEAGPDRGAAHDSVIRVGDAEVLMPGSNAWAVSGTHTVHGGALLANDMHLGLRVPNTWFRARFEWRHGEEERQITGVTLPGNPAMIVGSNGRVAWGFTNSYCDFVDLVEVETDPEDDDRYRTAQGWRFFERGVETIRVKGGDERTIEVVSTVWGPIIDEDHRGRPRALRWTAHDPLAVDLGIGDLETARDVDEALAIAARAGIPGQNFVCADRDGRVGWTVMGLIPVRVGCDGRLPAEAGCEWQGWLKPEAHPLLVDPPDGRVWSANARVVSGAELVVLGDGGYALGARARQIRDRLYALERASEIDMLRLQLDDRAVFLERWQRLALEVLDPAAVAADPRRAEARRLVESWGGRASVESVGYRLVRAFRLTVRRDVIGALIEPYAEADTELSLRYLGQVEDSLWRLVSERPAHLLPPGFDSWEALLLESFDRTLTELLESCENLDSCTWGKRNTVAIQHPLSRVLPLVGRWLDMPAQPLPGGSNMPRVQSPGFGASERMVVSPGREHDGIFHMPCGQSGHPLSPFYRAGHDAWAKGEPTPFLPGPTVHSLKLVGAGS